MVDSSVAVIGGGIGGLTAAHELAERGFDVTVLEANDCFGGKARPMPAGTDSPNPPLHGEHGSRFFPAFYPAEVTQSVRTLTRRLGGRV